MNLDELKQQEAAAWAAFGEACQGVLDAGQAIKDLHNPIYAAGGQPIEYQHSKEAETAARQFVDYQAHLKSWLIGRERKQAIKKVRSKRDQTFKLG
jgi:hypothetical protein